MKTVLALLVFATMLGASCGGQVRPANGPGPVTLPDGGDSCDAMCSNERAVNSKDPCPGFTGEPSPGGTSCEDACHAQNPTFNLRTVCLAGAGSCTALKACYAN